MVSPTSRPNSRKVAKPDNATTMKPRESITEVIAIGRPTRRPHSMTASSGVRPAAREVR